jgi:hypothetical protein
MAAAVAVVLAMLLSSAAVSTAQHDYGNALHKCILFFEGQRSGRLPPDQRLRWRRDSGLHDGAAAGVRSPARPSSFTLTSTAYSMLTNEGTRRWT